MNKSICVQDLGLKDYKTTWDFQEELFKNTVDCKIKNRRQDAGLPTPNHFLFVSHPHVYTLGKSGDFSNLLLNEDQLTQKGATFYKINRGGDITYHGPQQLVGYPIMDLDKFKTDLGWYLRSLEQVIIDTIAEYGLVGERSAGETGVWLQPNDPFLARKICAMGIKCSRWITMHGFALNVNPDLSHFEYIVPCGIQGKTVTSLEKELGYKVNYEEVKEKIKKHFQLIFEADLI